MKDKTCRLLSKVVGGLMGIVSISAAIAVGVGIIAGGAWLLVWVFNMISLSPRIVDLILKSFGWIIIVGVAFMMGWTGICDFAPYFYKKCKKFWGKND